MKLSYPINCPSCHSITSFEGEYLMCTNSVDCPAQVVGRIKNWISELNILEWGDTLLEKLVKAGKVTTVADLYKLTIDDLANIDRMGQKSAAKCHKLLWEAKEVPLEVFLGAISIPTIGQSTIKAIINAGCDSLQKFGQLTVANFEEVPGVGPTKAKSLADGLKHNQQLILDILDAGVTIKVKAVGVLTGTQIAITGSTKNKRADLQKFITDNGGENKSSISKSCTHLVSNEKSESSKTKAALKLGIKVILEDDLINFVL